MIKKKSLVLLFTLLLALFLGSLSTCYAFDQIDLKNFCYNYMTIKDGKTTAHTLDWIDRSSAFSSLDSFCTPYYDNDNYKILLIGQGGNIYFLKKSSESTQKLVLRNTSSIDITANGYSGYHVWTNDFSNTDSNYTSVYFNNLKNSYFYTDDNIYYNNNVYFSAPKYYPNQHIFDEYYTRDKWIFTPNGTNGTVNGVNNENFSIISASWNTYLGSICNSQHVQKIYVSFATYNQPTGTWIPAGNSILLYDYDRDGNIALYFSGSSSSDGTNWTTGLYYKTINRQNCILTLRILSTAVESWATIVHNYYISNDYTYITGGVVYPNLTFSGDYNNEYNNQNNENITQENHDDLINTLTDSTFSGDVSLPTIEIEDPTGDFFTWFYTQFVSVLNNNNNTYITIPIWNTDYRVYSNVFVLPNGILREFIQARLVVGCWFTIFKIY